MIQPLKLLKQVGVHSNNPNKVSCVLRNRFLKYGYN